MFDPTTLFRLSVMVGIVAILATVTVGAASADDKAKKKEPLTEVVYVCVNVQSGHMRAVNSDTVCKNKELPVSWGSNGVGPVGPEGPEGPQGETGPQGPAGPQGLAGADGAPGQNGADGQDGAQGPTGEDGLDGFDGLDGLEGAEGPTGPQGVPGVDGAPGPAGEDGLDGFDGLDGLDGDEGPEGPTGPQGAQGSQGPAGADGADGAQGPAGPQGEPGVSNLVNFACVDGEVIVGFDGNGDPVCVSYLELLDSPPNIGAPIIVGSIIENDLGSTIVTASDPDGDEIEFTLDSAHTFVTIVDGGFGDDSATINFNPQSASGHAGIYTITVRATSQTKSDIESFSLTVIPDSAPVITPTDPQLVTLGDSVTLEISATDVDNDDIGLHISQFVEPRINNSLGVGYDTSVLGPNVVMVQETGLPGFESVGDIIEITLAPGSDPIFDIPNVANAVYNSGTTDPVPTIWVDSVPFVGDGVNPPIIRLVIASGGPPIGPVDIAYRVDADLLESGGPNIDATGSNTWEFTFTPTWLGNHEVTFTGGAQYGPLGTETLSLTVTAPLVDDPPAFLLPIDPQSVEEDEVGASIVFEANDPESDEVTLSLGVGTPGFVSITDAGALDDTAEVFFTPTVGDAGTYEIVVIASSTTHTVTAGIDLTVNAVADTPPVLASIGDLSVLEGTLKNIVLAASDAEGDNRVVSKSAGPAWITVTDNGTGDGSGTLVLNPASGELSGPHSVTVLVTANGLTDEETFDVTVLAAAILDDFDDAQGLTFPAHVPDISPATLWIEHFGDWEIDNGRAVENGAVVNLNRQMTIDALVSGLDVSVDITFNEGRTGTVVRFIDTANWTMAWFVGGSDNHVYLASVINGNFVLHAKEAYTWTVGETRQFSVDQSGSTISVSVDGVEIVTPRAVSFHSGSTNYGLFDFTPTVVVTEGNFFDNFSAS